MATSGPFYILFMQNFSWVILALELTFCFLFMAHLFSIIFELRVVYSEQPTSAKAA